MQCTFPSGDPLPQIYPEQFVPDTLSTPMDIERTRPQFSSQKFNNFLVKFQYKNALDYIKTFKDSSNSSDLEILASLGIAYFLNNKVHKGFAILHNLESFGHSKYIKLLKAHSLMATHSFIEALYTLNEIVSQEPSPPLEILIFYGLCFTKVPYSGDIILKQNFVRAIYGFILQNINNHSQFSFFGSAIFHANLSLDSNLVALNYISKSLSNLILGLKNGTHYGSILIQLKEMVSKIERLDEQPVKNSHQIELIKILKNMTSVFRESLDSADSSICSLKLYDATNVFASSLALELSTYFKREGTEEEMIASILKWELETLDSIGTSLTNSDPVQLIPAALTRKRKRTKRIPATRYSGLEVLSGRTKPIALTKLLKQASEITLDTIQSCYKELVGLTLTWFEEEKEAIQICFRDNFESGEFKVAPFSLDQKVVQTLFSRLEECFASYEEGAFKIIESCFMHFITKAIPWVKVSARDNLEFINSRKFKALLSGIDEEESEEEAIDEDLEDRLVSKSNIEMLHGLRRNILSWIQENPLKFINLKQGFQKKQPVILLKSNKNGMECVASTLYFQNGFWPVSFISQNDLSQKILSHLCEDASIVDVQSGFLNLEQKVQFKLALDRSQFKFQEDGNVIPFIVLRSKENGLGAASESDRTCETDYEPQTKRSKKGRTKLLFMNYTDIDTFKDKFKCELLDFLNFPVIQDTRKIIHKQQFREAVSGSNLPSPLHNTLSEILRLSPSDLGEVSYFQRCLKLYQQICVSKMIDLHQRGIPGVLLAPQPGLGKTRMMAEFFMYLLKETPGPILYLGPIATVLQSIQEFQRSFSESILDLLDEIIKTLPSFTFEELALDGFLSSKVFFSCVQKQISSYSLKKVQIEKEIKEGEERVALIESLRVALSEKTKKEKQVLDYKLVALKETLALIGSSLDKLEAYKNSILKLSRDNHYSHILEPSNLQLDNDPDIFEKCFGNKCYTLISFDIFNDFIDKPTWEKNYCFSKKRAELSEKSCIVFLNLETLDKKELGLADMPWQAIGVDEAQKIANATTKHYKLVNELILSTKEKFSRPFVLLSTGTPFINDVSELTTYLNLFAPQRQRNQSPEILSMVAIANQLEIKKRRFLTKLSSYFEKPSKKKDAKEDLFKELLALFSLSESFKTTLNAVSIRVTREEVVKRYEEKLPKIIPSMITPSLEHFEEQKNCINEIEKTYHEKLKSKVKSIDGSLKFFIAYVKRIWRVAFHPKMKVELEERNRLSANLSRKSQGELLEFAKESALLTEIFDLANEDYYNGEFSKKLEKGVVFFVDEKAIGYAFKNLVSGLFDAEAHIITGEDEAEYRKIIIDGFEREMKKGERRALILLIQSSGLAYNISKNGSFAYFFCGDFRSAEVEQSMSRINRLNSLKEFIVLYEFDIPPVGKRILWHRSKKETFEGYYLNELTSENLPELFMKLYHGLYKSLNFPFYKGTKKRVRQNLKAFFNKEIESGKNLYLKKIQEKNPLLVEPSEGVEEDLALEENPQEDLELEAQEALMTLGQVRRESFFPQRQQDDYEPTFDRVSISDPLEESLFGLNESDSESTLNEGAAPSRPAKGKEKVGKSLNELAEERALEEKEQKKIENFLLKSHLNSEIIRDSIIETTLPFERKKWWILPLCVHGEVLNPKPLEEEEEGEIREKPAFCHNLEKALQAGMRLVNAPILEVSQALPHLSGIGLTARTSLYDLKKAHPAVDKLLFDLLQKNTRNDLSIEALKDIIINMGLYVSIYKVVSKEGQTEILKIPFVPQRSAGDREVVLLELGSGSIFHYDLLFPFGV
ncbi:SNF2-related protein [Criblamydia sequanensis]|uniref:SNF2 N-terminal domain-containing protein n=1 Tax=Candidatus Criblamydia sequanensis CRIB-18 TaxID=1437425 RepID=A0A090CXV9_9BACT|nr:SNF2-related protein [Criblamydia sequanensis]CDR32901.1 hypothetical protein CSEC_0057 [Criblamydia sequanensis CRIB-18]